MRKKGALYSRIAHATAMKKVSANHPSKEGADRVDKTPENMNTRPMSKTIIHLDMRHGVKSALDSWTEKTNENKNSVGEGGTSL